MFFRNGVRFARFLPIGRGLVQYCVTAGHCALHVLALCLPAPGYDWPCVELAGLDCPVLSGEAGIVTRFLSCLTAIHQMLDTDLSQPWAGLQKGKCGPQGPDAFLSSKLFVPCFKTGENREELSPKK